MKRILLCRTDAVGDLILTLPVVRSLKQAYPGLRTTLLAAQYTAPMLAGERYIDDIVTIPRRSLADMKEISGLARDLRRMKIDTAVLFYPRLSLALATYLGKIPIRIGTSRRAYSVFFNRRVRLQRRDSGKHELDLNYDLIGGQFPGLERYEPSLTVTKEEHLRAGSFLTERGIGSDAKFVIVHPFSHGSAPNWRVERYVRLIRALVADGTVVLVTGSQLEAPEIAAALGERHERIIDVAGHTDLPLLKALIKRASLLVSGSTGPIHIAGAVGTFAVGIYPPESALSPVRWGPRGGANKLFLPAVDQYEGSLVDLMDTIEVDSVYNFIAEHLQVDEDTRASKE